MAENVVSCLLEKLSRFISEEEDLTFCFKEEIESLTYMLERIRFDLSSFTEENIYLARELKQLADENRKLLYIMDKYVAIGPCRKEETFLARINSNLHHQSARCRLAKEIKGIRKKFEEMDKIFDIQAATQEEDRIQDNFSLERRLYLEERETATIGLDVDTKARAIIEQLTKGEAGRDVISIVGMGRIGKTTLARQVYNNQIIVKHFNFRAWINVSVGDRVTDLLRALLRRAVGMTMEEMKDMSDDELSFELRRYLRSTRYMVVLDNIWKTEIWDELNQVLDNNMYGSRIIITTRFPQLAEHVNPRSPPHYLRFLSKEESWELFSKKVFLEERFPSDLEKIGEQLVHKCLGHPLAIVALAGVLLHKEKTPQCWSRVLSSLSANHTDATSILLKIMELSYNNLPCHLKTCFLYFGLFPRDFEISAKQLIRLWIAEGFVQEKDKETMEEEKDKETMEEVGEDYLEDLIARNFVQVCKRHLDGTVKACRIHDLLHKTCVLKVKEEKFLEVRAFKSSSALPSNLSRLGVHSSMLNYISSNQASSTLRSMLCFGLDERPLSFKEWKLIYKRFPLLRVLAAGNVGIEVIPDDIHKLIHLRYLGLKSLTAKTLPASISNLWNLQTLVVNAPCSNRPLLNIWKMKKLRHLHFHRQLRLSEPPKKVEDDSGDVLMNLQTLYCISPDSCTESVFSMLPNLLKLGIYGNLEEHRLSKKFQNFSKLNRLLTLKLERDRSCKNLDSLRYVEFPPRLRKLTLVETQLLADPMDILGQLPNLQVLILKNASYNGRNLNCHSNGFPKLEVLKLINLAICCWNISQSSMASLRCVVINRCGLLEGLPSALRNMPALQELEISYHAQLVKEAREIEMSRGKEQFKLVIFQS
ncbi:disease resistance protein RPP13-like [Actinidia eriantha]|uniref:disease resistance protein RPP13-like n=1 Tax=Actinidia eriantha TaxID=165200 RepID=UPI00258AC648|nr:disease resistance protein RPP13-like [Actinidia eriantha]